MATLCIHAMIDDVMARLMDKLETMIPIWKKKVRLQVSQNGNFTNLQTLDSNGAPYEIFKKVHVASGNQVSTFSGSQLCQSQ